MTSLAAGRRTPRARSARLRWLTAVPGNVVFVISGVPAQLAALAALALPWLIPKVVPTKFGPVMAALAVSAVLALAVRVPLTFIQRHRCWSMLGIDIPPPPRASGASATDRLGRSLRSEATWRQLAYHLAIGPALATGGLLTLALLAAGAGFAGMWGWTALLAPSSAAAGQSPKLKFIAAFVGVGMLLAGCVCAALVAWLDRLAVTALLGPSRSLELERRVETLSQSRAGVVDAADTERRRIERDLHDGAQQRLVSLAMNLGIARETLTGLPEPARRVIADAHDEAKEALAELRNLVRGLHPAVLDDRGLDAALSGIAARAPLPVRLRVDVVKRASPTVEAVAYFIVSECLANIARHSSARQASIEVRRVGGILHVEVSDDGIGAADPARGSGLASLSQRAKSVDGSLQVSSPVGGPTVISAELPCES